MTMPSLEELKARIALCDEEMKNLKALARHYAKLEDANKALQARREMESSSFTGVVGEATGEATVEEVTE